MLLMLLAVLFAINPGVLKLSAHEVQSEKDLLVSLAVKQELIEARIDAMQSRLLERDVGFTVFFNESGESELYPPGNIVPFKKVVYNTGEYNAQDSSFTCPVNGVYLFIVNVYTESRLSVNLLKNSEIMFNIDVDEENHAIRSMGSNIYIGECIKNERIQVMTHVESRINHDGGTDMGTRRNSFAGFLLTQSNENSTVVHTIEAYNWHDYIHEEALLISLLTKHELMIAKVDAIQALLKNKLQEKNDVGFTAFFNESGGSELYPPITIVPFKEAMYNTGEYDTEDSAFTCPVNGVYLFVVNVYTETRLSVNLVKNNEIMFNIDVDEEKDTVQLMGSNIYIGECMENSRIQVITYEESSINHDGGIDMGTHRNSFAGFLLSQTNASTAAAHQATSYDWDYNMDLPTDQLLSLLAANQELHEARLNAMQPLFEEVLQEETVGFTAFFQESGSYVEYPADTVVPFKNVKYNSGDYIIDESEFTCPVTGIYLFVVNVYTERGLSVNLLKDGDILFNIDVSEEKDRAQIMGSNMYIGVCSETEKVEVKTHEASVIGHEGAQEMGTERSSFAGFLLSRNINL